MKVSISHEVETFVRNRHATSSRVFVCHDYMTPGRDGLACETTIGEQRRANVHVRDGVDEDAFVAMRTARDATLAMPRLMYSSIQVNMRAGHLPPPAPNGRRYLLIPLDDGDQSAPRPEASIQKAR